MTITNKTEFLTLLKGATFLASGGGGPFSLAKSVVEHYFTDDSPFTIEIKDLETLTDKDWGCVVAGMADPSEAQSLKPQDFIESTVNSVNTMQQLIQTVYIPDTSSPLNTFSRFNNLVLGEMGAMNVVIPLMTAYKLGNGISVVNGDSVGRSAPTINLTTFASTQPVMPNMATPPGDTSDFTTLSLDSYSDLSTAYSQLIGSGVLGRAAGMSLAPMNGTTLKDNNLVDNTLAIAYAIGTILENSNNSNSKINDIIECMLLSMRGAKLLCTGKVVAYNTESVNDADVGYMSIETTDKRTFTVSIQNETITGQFEDETGVAVTGPDSICYLSTSDGALPDNKIYENTLIQEQFEKGEEVNIHVIAIQADPVVLGNPTLMASWKNTYTAARYYGAYNSNIWTTS